MVKSNGGSGGRRRRKNKRGIERRRGKGRPSDDEGTAASSSPTATDGPWRQGELRVDDDDGDDGDAARHVSSPATDAEATAMGEREAKTALTMEGKAADASVDDDASDDDSTEDGDGVADDASTSREDDGSSDPRPHPHPQNNPDPNTFEAITPPLSPSILHALRTHPAFSFTRATPVQIATIPHFLRHRDVCVGAVTGSGKTLAFLVPMVEMLLRREVPLTRGEVGGLVLSPTRELAAQTCRVAEVLCDAAGMTKPLLLVGGSNRTVLQDLQRFHEYGSDILIATPGRLDDVLTRYDNISVRSCLECLVLDEADVLLDMGFQTQLTSILDKLPRMRRTGMFSATQTRAVRMLARAGLRNPVLVNVAVAAVGASEAGDSSEAGTGGEEGGDKGNPTAPCQGPERTRGEECTPRRPPNQQATPSSLTNYYLVCPLDRKLDSLAEFLLRHPSDKVVVFFLTCACVEFFGAAMQQLLVPRLSCGGSSYHLEPLHGKMVQKRREKALERFRGTVGGDSDGDDSGRGRSCGGALFCTDVAARGLDVTDVNWVVQFDAPPDPSSFVHRVGRCARAGRVGRSLVLLTEKEEAYVDFLRRRGVPLTELETPSSTPMPTSTSSPACLGSGGVGASSEGDGGDASGQCQGDGEDDDVDPLAVAERATRGQSLSRTASLGTTADVATNGGRKVVSRANQNSMEVLPAIKKLILQDRDLLEKGTKAFTSYIRAYKEHHCAFIFRFASLDLGLLATSFCLLRLPKMPELKPHLGKLNFTPAGPEIDIHAIRYKDKNREKARQKRLAAELAAGGKNAKQIKAEQRAADKIRRAKEKRATSIAKGRNPNKKRGRQQQIFDEWDELAKEERLHKKLRRGKITEDEYRRLMYGDSNNPESDMDA